MKTFRLTFITLTALLFAANGLQAHAAAHAAKIVYAFGQVQALGVSGKGRQVRKGDQIFPGETVATVRGRAQIKFTDGGFASLQPNTQYKIDDYNFEGEADGKERSFLSLIKGSVRLVTGVIGRANRNNFRLKTKVATIGIRGTLGKASHCDSDCGNLPVGTYMQGYGGKWLLNSGSFSGLVESGDAYLCNGATCNQVQGGIVQREDVGEFEDEEEDEDRYQQGQQVDGDGVLCDLGGACGDSLVLLDQVGALAFQGSPGDASSGPLIVVTSASGPIAGLFFEEDSDGEHVRLETINIDLFRAALNAFPDADVVSVGNLILDEVDPEILADLRAMPASVAPEDFGPTSDGLLTKGRWTNGYVLEVEAWLDSEDVEVTLRNLTDFQSEHFIYGTQPGEMPTGGSASYHFTGSTFSTATDGSSIGEGVTDGMLTWDFGLASGTVDFDVVHGPETFDVSGTIETSGVHTFFEDSVSALSSGMSYSVFLHGVFAGPNPGGAPNAAGLSYVIDMFSSRGYDLIGTAGFGLWADDSTSTAVVTGVIGPAPTGTYIAAGHAFGDGFVNNSNSWDFIVGGANTATLIDWSVKDFFASTSDFVCTPSCSFDSGTATQVESGSVASIGASWVGWGPGHTFVHPGFVSPLGRAHVVKLDAPATPLPTGVMGTYTLGVGGGTGATTPTMNSGPGGATFEVASSSTHTLVANFVTGNLSSVHDIAFPSGTLVHLQGSVVGAALGVQNVINYNPALSTITGVGCTGCIFGHDHFTFGGVGATHVVGAGQFNTSGASTDEIAGAFTFILPGSLAPYP